MGELLLILAVLAVMAVVIVLRRERARRSVTVEVVADEDGVRRVLADGRREAVRWPEVHEVDVFTTRVGPHKGSGGAIVLYGDAERGCIVPLDRLAESRLLDHAHRLPGFDPSAVVAAMGDPRDQPGIKAMAPKPMQRTTVVWRREDT